MRLYKAQITNKEEYHTVISIRIVFQVKSGRKIPPQLRNLPSQIFSLYVYH